MTLIDQGVSLAIEALAITSNITFSNCISSNPMSKKLYAGWI
jgi:hypothetical protein